MQLKNPEVVLASSITWSKCRWCHWWHLWLLTLLSSPLVFLSGSWRCPLTSPDSYPLRSKFGRKECLFFGISLQIQKFPWLELLVDFGCRESMMMMIGGYLFLSWTHVAEGKPILWLAGPGHVLSSWSQEWDLTEPIQSKCWGGAVSRRKSASWKNRRCISQARLGYAAMTTSTEDSGAYYRQW